MPEETEAKVLEQHHIDPDRFRSYVMKLALASQRLEKKKQAKAQVSEHIDTLKKLALNKRSTKGEIETQIEVMQDNILKIIRDETKILEEQKVDTRLIRQLKETVDGLNSKLVEMAREYADNLDEKDTAIQELKSNLDISEAELDEHKGTRGDRRKRIEALENRIKDKMDQDKKEIQLYEKQLKELESKYKDIKKKGKHKKEDLARVKKVIDTHKKTLKAKKERVKARK